MKIIYVKKTKKISLTA